MPIYEYDCQKCGEQVEVLVRGQETPVCPKCSSEALLKRLSVPAAPATGGLSTVGSADLPPCRPGCCRIPQ